VLGGRNPLYRPINLMRNAIIKITNYKVVLVPIPESKYEFFVRVNEFTLASNVVREVLGQPEHVMYANGVPELLDLCVYAARCSHRVASARRTS